MQKTPEVERTLFIERERCPCDRGLVAADQRWCMACLNEEFARYGEHFRRAVR